MNNTNNPNNNLNNNNTVANNHAMVNQIMNTKIAPQLKAVNTNSLCDGMNFSHAPGPKNFEGYDVAGCRYDLNFRPQNNTIHGPPLADCNAYDTNKLRTTGTLWYPLHG